MFWALIMEPYKRYTQCVQHSFHVSMASLDTSLAEETPVQVMVNYKERNFLLCTLKKNKMWQIPLDLNFEKGTNLTFLCNGRGPVHLTGYLLPTYDSNSEGSSTDISISSVEAEEEKELSLEEGEEEKEQSLEQEEAPIEKHLKRKAESPKSGKKVKQAKKRSFSESNNQDDSEENSRFSKEDADSDEDMEDEEVEEDEDDDDEKKTEQQKQKIKQRIRQDLASLQEIVKSEKKETENQQQHQQKKKHDKQNKINGEEIQQEQQSKKQKKKVEQHTQQIDQNEAKKRIVEGGVQVEDIKSGNGALATSGKLLTVYYVGRCKIGSQQKKIDSCLQGNGFKFRLGKGQVIKGWDVGLVGMKVGGKRRLTIPSHMGYGAKGSPPTIPGNSTLVFDIELKNVN